MSEVLTNIQEQEIAIADVLKELQKRINERPRNQTYDDLSNISGVSINWIERFARNRINKPHFHEVVSLWDACFGVNPLTHGFVKIV